MNREEVWLRFAGEALRLFGTQFQGWNYAADGVDYSDKEGKYPHASKNVAAAVAKLADALTEEYAKRHGMAVYR